MTSSFSLGAAAAAAAAARPGMSLDQFGVSLRASPSALALPLPHSPEGPDGLPTLRPEPSIISAQEAVQAEVVVEEQEMAGARMREEVEEATRSMRKRAWWQRWAFTSVDE